MAGCVDARVCVCVCGWLPVCIKLASKSALFPVLLACFFSVFFFFLRVMHFARARVFCLITVLCLFLECLSSFESEATFLSKSKLSWRNCLWTAWKKRAFVYACVVSARERAYARREGAIKGAPWWRECMKGVRGETEWQAAEGAACGGGQGGAWGGWCRCLILRQPRAFLCPIYLTLPRLCMGAAVACGKSTCLNYNVD